MDHPDCILESSGSERYTCLLGIGEVQSGLTCFFLKLVYLFSHLSCIAFVWVQALFEGPPSLPLAFTWIMVILSGEFSRAAWSAVFLLL
jgi:hypothetical protein